MRSVALLVLALAVVFASAVEINETQREQIVRLFENLTNSSNNSLSPSPVPPPPHNRLVEILGHALEVDRCLSMSSTLLFDALYVTLSLPEELYNNTEVLLAVVTSLTSTPAYLNKHCVEVVNIIRYVSLELAHLVGLSKNDTYVPLEDQVTDLSKTKIGKIVENTKTFNAFYYCIYGNFQLINGVYQLYKSGIMDQIPLAAKIALQNSLFITADHNLEQCAVAGVVVSNALEKMFAKKN